MSSRRYCTCLFLCFLSCPFLIRESRLPPVYLIILNKFSSLNENQLQSWFCESLTLVYSLSTTEMFEVFIIL